MESLISAQRLTASEVWHVVNGVRKRSLVLVLNALRHQRFGTSSRPFRIMPGAQCSTPYGIRGLAPVRWSKMSSNSIECSTPYGIRGLAHSGGTRQRAGSLQCSTPYGIRGLAPNLSIKGSLFAPSAQRLTASEVWHLSTRLDWQTYWLCSTPYGIRGLARNLFWGKVIVAIRAQRLTASEVWHPLSPPRMECPNLSRAQRLTASEVWHSRSPQRSRRIYCAQRLTASEVWHESELSADFLERCTCSTPYGIRGLARTCT